MIAHIASQTIALGLIILSISAIIRTFKDAHNP
jgi:hypothetical protein